MKPAAGPRQAEILLHPPRGGADLEAGGRIGAEESGARALRRRAFSLGARRSDRAGRCARGGRRNSVSARAAPSASKPVMPASSVHTAPRRPRRPHSGSPSPALSQARATSSHVSRVRRRRPCPPHQARARSDARPTPAPTAFPTQPRRDRRPTDSAAFSATSVRAILTARISGTVSSAPDAALASAPVSSGALRSWVMTAAAPNAAARTQDGAHVAWIGDLIEHEQRAGPLERVLQGRRGERIGEQRKPLMHDVAAQQLIEPRPLHPLGGNRPGLAQPLGKRRRRLLRHHETAEPAGRVGERGGDRVLAVEPDSTARRVRARRRGWAWPLLMRARRTDAAKAQTRPLRLTCLLPGPLRSTRSTMRMLTARRPSAGGPLSGTIVLRRLHRTRIEPIRNE